MTSTAKLTIVKSPDLIPSDRQPKPDAPRARRPRATRGGNSPQTVDPLIAVAARMKDAVDRFNEIDKRIVGADAETRKEYRDDELENLSDVIISLKDYASTLHASSIEGAIFQIALADALWEQVGGCEQSAKEARLKMRRLMFSAVGALSKFSNTEPSHLALEYLMGRNTNPWIRFEQLVAKFNSDNC